MSEQGLLSRIGNWFRGGTLGCREHVLSANWNDRRQRQDVVERIDLIVIAKQRETEHVLHQE